MCYQRGCSSKVVGFPLPYTLVNSLLTPDMPPRVSHAHALFVCPVSSFPSTPLLTALSHLPLSLSHMHTLSSPIFSPLSTRCPLPSSLPPLAPRNAIESLSTAYARAAGGGAINRCADSGLGLIGGVSCTILFSPLLAPLAGRSYRVGDLCGRATPPPPLPSPPRAGSSQVVGAGDGRQGNDHQDSRVVVGARSDNDAPGDSERQQGRPRSAKGGDGATDGLKQEQQQQQQPGIVGDVTAAAAAAAASVKDGSSSMTSAGRGVGSGRGGVVSAESSPSCSPAGVTASLRGADDGLGGLQPMDESDPDSNHSGGGVGAVHQERVGSAGGGSAGVQTAGGVWRAGDALVGGAAAVTGSGGNVGVGGPQEGENAQGRVPGGERGMMKAAVQQQNQKQERFHQQHQHQLQPVHGSGLGRRSPDSDRGGSFASRCSSEAAIDQVRTAQSSLDFVGKYVQKNKFTRFIYTPLAVRTHSCCVDSFVRPCLVVLPQAVRNT